MDVEQLFQATHSIVSLFSQMQAGGPGKIRDIETEELIEDQQQVSQYTLYNFRNLWQNIAANPGAPGWKHNFTISQFQRIRELEAGTTGLREKLLVAKQQLLGCGGII